MGVLLSEATVAVALRCVTSASAVLMSEAQGVGFCGATCLGSDDLLHSAILLHLMAQGTGCTLTDPPVALLECGLHLSQQQAGKCCLKLCHQALEFCHGDNEPLAAALLVVVGVLPLSGHVLVVCCQGAVTSVPQQGVQDGLCLAAVGHCNHVEIERVACVAGAVTRQDVKGVALTTCCQTHLDRHPVMLAVEKTTGDVVALADHEIDDARHVGFAAVLLCQAAILVSGCGGDLVNPHGWRLSVVDEIIEAAPLSGGR